MMMFVAGLLIGFPMGLVLVGAVACVISAADSERKDKKK